MPAGAGALQNSLVVYAVVLRAVLVGKILLRTALRVEVPPGTEAARPGCSCFFFGRLSGGGADRDLQHPAPMRMLPHRHRGQKREMASKARARRWWGQTKRVAHV
jgi:hypothetical protein